MAVRLRSGQANEDKATRYHRLQRRASLVAVVTGASFLLTLLVSGRSAAIRTWVQQQFAGAFLPSVIAYVAIVGLLYEVVQLPLAFYRGVVLERRYGLSTETPAHWAIDQVKALGLALVFSAAGAVLVLALIRQFPLSWWIAAAVLFVAVIVVFAQLAPVLLLPVFYDFKPLDRPALADRLVRLAQRAGARVMGVFEWRLSDRTRKANAALTGIGRTRRILISDTLLAAHSDDEIEVVLAHELAHHVHRDIWTAIALEAGLITVGFYVANAILELYGRSFGLAGKSDVAALPLLVLGMAGASIVLRPIGHALSRAHERRADRYALEMTGNAEAFVSAMKRLAAQNLAEEQPSRLVELLLHSHPSTGARIAAAQQWARGREREHARST
jgi:STE24 endopeptidase